MTSRRSNSPGQPLMHWNHALYAMSGQYSPRGRSAAEVRHDLAGEELHRAADLVLGQPPEVHPAEHVADAHVAHGLDVARHRVGRAERHRLGHEALPGHLLEALRGGP